MTELQNHTTPTENKWGAFWYYGLAVLATVIAGALRILIDPLVGMTTQYMLFLFAVIFVTVMGGIGPGLVTIALSAVEGMVIFYYQGYIGDSWIDEITRLCLFLLLGVFVILLAERLIKAQKQADTKAAELADSENRLAQAVRVTGMGIFVYNNRSDTITMSDKAKEIFDWKKREMPSLNSFLEHVLPEDRQMVVSAIEQAQDPSGPGLFSAEYRFRKPDGNICWLTARAQTFFENRGGILLPVRTIGVILDITDQKTTEAELNRRNEGLRLLSQTTADLLTATDSRQMVHDLFNKVSSFLGADIFFNYMLDDPDSPTPLHLDAFGGLDENSLRKFSRLAMRQAICGTSAQTRQPIYEPDVQHSTNPMARLVQLLGVRAYACNPLMVGDRLLGTLSFASRSKDHFTPDDLEFIKTISHYAAMTIERLRIEQATRENEERLRLANEAGQIGTFDNDIRKNRVAYSPELCAILGVPVGHVDTIENVYQNIHPDDLERVIATMKSIENPATNNVAIIENRIIRPNGEVRWVSWSGHIIFEETPQGRIPVRVVGACMDITERKQAEEAMKKFNEELEKRVKERTAELEQAIAELQRSNADLRQFAYVSSHDLQEPLRMVASYVGLLEMRYGDKLDADARDFIRFAIEGAKRMQTLIKDLLEYSHIQTRAKSFAPVDCRYILATVLKNLQLRIKETQARITYDPLPTVWGDDTQLTQVFQNLIDNAIKFRRNDEPPQIHISLKKLGEQWEFCVRDNGIGIAPESFDKIFVIFQRLHTRTKYPGSGIGLAIVKRIVERHGGQVRIESQLGKGTAVYFTIPSTE